MFKIKTIHSNLFFTYSLFIIVILLFIVFFFYLYVSRLMTQTAFSSIEETCFSTTQQLDAEIDRMNTISLNISYSNLIKEEFNNYSDTKDTHSLLQRNVTLDHMFNILIALIGPNLTVSQINLYDFDHHMIGSGAINCSLSWDVTEQPWYENSMKNKGYKFISLPYTHTQLFSDISPYYKDYYMSLTRIYYDSFKAPKGIVEILQPCSKIFSSADSLLSSTDQPKKVYVYNEEGTLIYPYKNDGSQVYQDYYPQVLEKTEQHHTRMLKNADTKQEELLCYTTSKETGWTTVIVVDKHVLMKPIYSFTSLLVIFGLLILVLSLVLSYFLAKRITEPISRLKKLVRGMNTVEDLNTTSLITLDSGINELEELYRTVSNMSTDLNRSVTEVILSHTQEAQAKFLALQSQMNPHFIYNTIANISILAEENRNKEAVEMCAYVSNMLRYITTDQKTVSLYNELAYTEEYLNCMKIRYGEDIKFETQIPEAMHDIEIPKLILQPLVENALKYGTEVDPPWHIRLQGFLTEETWTIKISDNGTGFTAMALQGLLAQMAEIDACTHLPSLSLNGMGILNIYIRLRLFYGSALIFNLTNLNNGAMITLGGPRNIKGVAHDDKQ